MNTSSCNTRRRNLAAAAVVSVLLLAACSKTTPPIELKGQVVNDKTNLPIAGVDVSVGAEKFATGVDGRFTLTDLPAGGTVAFEDCAYSPFTLRVPIETGSQDVELHPLSVSGIVTSDLTGEGISAHVSGKVKAKTDQRGRLTLSGLCSGDQLHVSAKGYAEASAQVTDSRKVRVALKADPATTVVQEVAWESAQKWGLACSLVHPDARAYISNDECIKMLASDASVGYQNVSIKVKSLTYIRWTFPRCTLGDFGPKTYPRTAAINYTLQQSTPSGGVTPISGIQHWVQTKDGLWRWFPNNGCDYPVS